MLNFSSVENRSVCDLVYARMMRFSSTLCDSERAFIVHSIVPKISAAPAVTLIEAWTMVSLEEWNIFEATSQPALRALSL